MELKNVNSNGNNVVISNLINVKFFFWKLWKLSSKTKIVCLKKEDIMIAPKPKFLILFTSQIDTEWIKVSFVDMDLFHKKK
jgi:hypothetical protein